MAARELFSELPATFPEEDQFRKPSIYGSIVFHAVVILALALVPFLTVQKMDELEIIARLVSPIGPPPAPLSEPRQLSSLPVKQPPPIEPAPAQSEGALVMPSVIPPEIAQVVDVPVASPSGGVIGGVPGGIPGGTAGGILGGFLAANADRDPVVAPPAPPPPLPPPPPPPSPVPSKPIRVGGEIREPRIVKMVPPVYPKLASLARVGGFVVIEAVVTPEGTVEEIRVVSGHPLLVDAAIRAVKLWRYEPTYLNGVPISIELTAKVEFRQLPES